MIYNQNKTHNKQYAYFRWHISNTMHNGLSHWSLGDRTVVVIYCSNLQTHINDIYFEHFLLNCHQVVIITPHRWSANIRSGNGLVPKAIYLNQCWPRSVSPYVASKPQWVNRSYLLKYSKCFDEVIRKAGMKYRNTWANLLCGCVYIFHILLSYNYTDMDGTNQTVVPSWQFVTPA